MSYKFWLWLARNLPAKLRYWTVIDAGCKAIKGDEEIPAVTFATVLHRMPS